MIFAGSSGSSSGPMTKKALSPISATSFCAASFRLPWTITFAPSRAKSRTMPSPIPVVEPVTRITLSCRRILAPRSLALTPPDERHICRHHCDELDIRAQRQAGHVKHGLCNGIQIHPRFDDHFAVGLQRPAGDPRHARTGVADIDLAAGNIVRAAIERDGPGQPGDRMLGRRVRRGIGPGYMRGNGSVVDDAAPLRLL